MARKKAEIPQETQETIIAEEVQETQGAVAAGKQEQIPENADRLLRIFCEYKALYISSKGGVYPEGTQPDAEDVVLYQNPYYKQ